MKHVGHFARGGSQGPVVAAARQRRRGVARILIAGQDRTCCKASAHPGESRAASEHSPAPRAPGSRPRHRQVNMTANPNQHIGEDYSDAEKDTLCIRELAISLCLIKDAGGRNPFHVAMATRNIQQMTPLTRQALHALCSRGPLNIQGKWFSSAREAVLHFAGQIWAEFFSILPDGADSDSCIQEVIGYAYRRWADVDFDWLLTMLDFDVVESGSIAAKRKRRTAKELEEAIAVAIASGARTRAEIHQITGGSARDISASKAFRALQKLRPPRTGRCESLYAGGLEELTVEQSVDDRSNRVHRKI